ncbi:hypothetical protein Prum_039620 [Phytohabitans rumicis]|uniref:Uncharacterized protein n=2 Tax=Phytohabitans rumicis TaxID=1076125 RepID=A0A6V8L452_9ACTN|nr:hypothetical protein Prum_039620 [Phytohabitans rumicis]
MALLVLAPWAAECSWGGFTLQNVLPVVLILAPLYGGAAVVIREIARRTGGGWPAIILLAAAFGLFQAALVDQSLFNPRYLDDTEFADWAGAANATRVPVLGFSAEQAFDYIGNHVALSICAPIALVESFVGAQRRHRPWLGASGLAAVAVMYVLGSLLIFFDDSGRKSFTASPLQLLFAGSVVLTLVGAAILPRFRHRRTPATANAPRPLWIGMVVLVAHLASWLVTGWPAVAVRAAVVAVVATVIVIWSRRAGWGQRHVLAAGSAGLLVAAAQAYLVPNYAPASPTAALVGDVAVSVITLTLVGGAFWRLSRTPTPVRPT